MLYETTITKIPLGELAETLEYINRNEESDERADAENKMDKFLYEINARAAHMTKSVKEVDINSVEIYNAYHVVFSLADIDSDENGATVWGIDLTVQDDNERNIASFRVKPSEDDVLVMRHTEGCCNALIYTINPKAFMEYTGLSEDAIQRIARKEGLACD